ncbi:flagellin [uncultured Paludibaculum sp.]|uniref:flagellin n=1 Tax=uncultured Paludibaculum sp. TaxID=1765020 RepID=UPI002AABE374|nr:flagellin [uncultured Paludibaculum sp.]
MTSGISASAQRFLLDIKRLQDRGDRAQGQISSNKRVETASDDPVNLGTLMSLKSQLAKSVQARSNLGRFQSEVDMAETSLRQAVSLLDTAVTLASQGASTDSTADRSVLANQVRGLMTQMVSIANTNVEGRYIFSGGSDQKAAYAVNLSSTNGVDQTAQFIPGRQVQDALGNSLSTGLTADTIFNASGSDGVFKALNDLRLALEQDSATDTQAAAAALDTASTYLNQQLAHYGDLQNQITTATNSAAKLELSWKTAISGIEDTDLAAAALEVTENKTAREAAYSAESGRPRTSLFDYLK